MSKERIWNGRLPRGKREELTVRIAPDDAEPKMLRATLVENGAVLEHILLPPKQLGEFVQRLIGTVPRAKIDYSRIAPLRPEQGTTAGPRTPRGSGPRG